MLHTELLAGLGTVAGDKVAGRHSLLTFRLQFEKFQRSLASGTHE